MGRILLRKGLWGLLNVIVIATAMFALVWLGLQAVDLGQLVDWHDPTFR